MGDHPIKIEVFDSGEDPQASAEATSLGGALLAATTLAEEAVNPVSRIEIRLRPGWRLSEDGSVHYSAAWL